MYMDERKQYSSIETYEVAEMAKTKGAYSSRGGL